MFAIRELSGIHLPENHSSVERNLNLWGRLVLRYVREGILCIDPDGRCSYASPRACELLGRRSNELLGCDLHILLHGKKARHCDSENCAILRLQCHQQAQSKLNDVFGGTTGRQLPVDYLIDPLFNGNHYLGAVLVFQDATERLAIEALQMEEERKWVERSEQLEEFTYQFAHDIKEPLRTLNYSCDFLREELSDDENAVVEEIIDNMSTSTARLQRMIEDSLDYAVSRTQELDLTPICLTSCIQKVIGGLELVIREYNARIMIGELPEVVGDPCQIERVFQNLIQNALKFHSEQPPVVRIYSCACEEPGYELIVVQDNGIGIEPEYHQKVFGTFQRLHSHQKFDGSGIGLAFVRKSLERQGGSAWVDSTPGVGSTFFLRMKATA